MSYTKMMKQINNHRKDKNRQPVLGMPFKENEHVESYTHMVHRTAESYHVKALIDNEWIKVSIDYLTENEAVTESFKLDETYNRTRIYSDKDMVIAGW